MTAAGGCVRGRVENAAMFRDPIVEELREIGRRAEEACRHDWETLFAHFLDVRKGCSRPILSRAPRPLPRPRSAK